MKKFLVPRKSIQGTSSSLFCASISNVIAFAAINEEEAVESLVKFGEELLAQKYVSPKNYNLTGIFLCREAKRAKKEKSPWEQWSDAKKNEVAELALQKGHSFKSFQVFSCPYVCHEFLCWGVSYTGRGSTRKISLYRGALSTAGC